MADLDVPIALRRPRRSIKTEPAAAPALTPAPKTPRRRVRFSDPGPLGEASGAPSGLTPFIRRTSLTTPKRRSSTTSRGGGTQAPPLHQTADGRVERRIRRGNLRDLLNKLEQQKRHDERRVRAHVDRLRAEVAARDREIYELQNATVVIDTERIWGLERQIDDLRDELRRREAVTPPGAVTPDRARRDWTPGDDPFSDDLTDAMDDDHFGDATMAQFVASTPSRARSSFPTPPATSPNVPTPCARGKSLRSRTPQGSPGFAYVGVETGVQACLPDPARQQLDEELASLNLEVSKLTATLDSYRGLYARVSGHVASAMTPTPEDAAGPPLEALEQRVQRLARAMSDRTAALAQLSAGINELGFPGSDAGEMVAALASGLRAARLELEYLTPGEIALPLTSRGAEVLDLLLTRLRALAARAREDEASIDEYHEIEQSLRKQLDARVSAMDGLRAGMEAAERAVEEQRERVRELEVGNERLKGAVDGYARDMAELERLVERVEGEARDAAAAHDEALSTSRADAAALEQRLEEAARQTAGLRRELSDVQDATTRHVVALNRRHGAALALRDARVLELRGEVDRVNEALRAAHETMRARRLEERAGMEARMAEERTGMESRMAEERARAKEAMDAMRAELRRVLEMSQAFVVGQDAGQDGGEVAGPDKPVVVARPGTFFAGKLARRSSTRLKGRDSGMGLLEEDEDA
ncbi:hypothetical protein JDV02_003884 [Purpureocillium takamizusanense]|uniref:Uncharacterized protein n=1 Tax=Purpureocillium takamizusanense TaxID=2060973 RepID=A0A9Q8QEQ3_9HYPO|nr:uncharacterized protein JDV02_003884 [Purpureocillium takamizusanense]UNI17551.1 hypothetical protein JDV02_003884 [Purpureocillium takamizusanense]